MIKTQYDAATNITVEVNFIEADIKQLEADQIVQAQAAEQANATATAKAALLNKLGITADEAALLLQ
jgi:hypothetical protein